MSLPVPKAVPAILAMQSPFSCARGSRRKAIVICPPQRLNIAPWDCPGTCTNLALVIVRSSRRPQAGGVIGSNSAAIMRTGTSLFTGAFASALAEETRHAAHNSGVAVRLSVPPRPNVGDICEGCCQSNANRSPEGAFWSLRARPSMQRSATPPGRQSVVPCRSVDR